MTTSPPTGSASAEACISPLPAPTTTVRITSERLFSGAQEVRIEHRGLVYRLRQTSLGKLILTK